MIKNISSYKQLNDNITKNYDLRDAVIKFMLIEKNDV